MAHNQKMLEERGAIWNGRVRLIGLSLDEDVEELKNHIDENGWNLVEHYHAANGRCSADEEFGV